jgi:Endopolygalacturonase
MIDCRNVHIADLTMKDAACWMQNYLNCENLLLEGLTVRNHANYNNDGMDIDGCRNVVIRNSGSARG